MSAREIIDDIAKDRETGFTCFHYDYGMGMLMSYIYNLFMCEKGNVKGWNELVEPRGNVIPNFTYYELAAMNLDHPEKLYNFLLKQDKKLAKRFVKDCRLAQKKTGREFDL